ncbi:MAG: polysaccharide export outer membrane protein [Gammaproteobacteria bacterium]|nr:MAG: polysaccharide export outer membrane protein [Gammaproteobacteria bacterium]TND05334.1 MAG: polysaccharide export outer membrane protein [Gammaproteobacteria bacterium]
MVDQERSKQTGSHISVAPTALTLMLLTIIMFGDPVSAAEPIGMDRAYQVGPQDVLEILVWEEKDLQRTVLIRPDGRFSFPLVGEIEASGRSPGDIQKEVSERLKKYIPNPVVTVLVTEIAAYKIYVIGQVKQSGEFKVGRYLDVMQTLALAGGLTPFAAEDKIIILRRQNDTEVIIPFKYDDVKKGRNLDSNIILQRGDVVIVP